MRVLVCRRRCIYTDAPSPFPQSPRQLIPHRLSLCPPLSSCCSFLPFPRPHSAADSKLAGLPISKTRRSVKSWGRGCTIALPDPGMPPLPYSRVPVSTRWVTQEGPSQCGTDPTIQQDVPAPNTTLSLCPDPLVGLVRAV